MIKIQRETEWYRPYKIPNEKQYVGSIIFHNGLEEVFKIKAGFISKNGSSDVEVIELSELRKARKVDFSKEDNFYITGHKDTIINESTIDLYILVNNSKSNIEIKDFVDKLYFTNLTGDQYQQDCTITNLNSVDKEISCLVKFYTKANARSEYISNIIKDISTDLHKHASTPDIINALIEKGWVK